MARIRHVEERDGRWYFLFQPEAGESFESVLRLFKWHLPVAERAWHEDTKRWSVAVSEENNARLDLVFANFVSARKALKDQLSLFSLGAERDG